ncbi:EipB family protein [Kiloniella sp.]|uniref:EipB family protein n=1 Tax=Kiloniella sp. TaxID=1938587 RepID=UPI003B0274CC
MIKNRRTQDYLSPHIYMAVIFVTFITLILSTVREVYAAPAGIDLLPHKAVYSLGLKASDRGAINAMSGHITYDWTGDCKGWVVKNELDMDVAYSSGQTVRMELRFSTWEAQDGSRYRFAVHQNDSISGVSSYIGRALRNDENNLVAVEITAPEQGKAELKGALFPTAFLSEIIQAAQSGKMSISYPVFDGTTELKAFNVSAVILPVEGQSSLPEMAGLKAWRVFLGFYEQDAVSSVPVQEQSLLLYENGVVTEIELDFGEFVVAGDLVEFEATKAPICE